MCFLLGYFFGKTIQVCINMNVVHTWVNTKSFCLIKQLIMCQHKNWAYCKSVSLPSHRTRHSEPIIDMVRMIQQTEAIKKKLQEPVLKNRFTSSIASN